jgi:predicted metalloprotease
VDDYWAATIPETFGETYRPPEVKGSFTSAQDAPMCGESALGTNNAWYCDTDNFIAWDELDFMLPVYEEFGDMASAMVIAHEFGHAVQALLGWRFEHSI